MSESDATANNSSQSQVRATQLDQFAFQMWLKIECHPNPESTQNPRTNSIILGSGRRGDLAMAVLGIVNFS